MTTATTTTTTEATTENAAAEVGVRTLRNFRSSADVENFYRFVNENSLRREAKMILEAIYARLTKDVKRKAKRGAKKARKLQ